MEHFITDVEQKEAIRIGTVILIPNKREQQEKHLKHMNKKILKNLEHSISKEQIEKVNRKFGYGAKGNDGNGEKWSIQSLNRNKLEQTEKIFGTIEIKCV